MEYIEGEDLHSLWPTMSWWARIKLVWTIRGYIHQLRRIRAPFPHVPGPVSPTGAPEVCFAAAGFTEDGAGPFESYSDLAAYFNMLRGVSLHSRFAAHNTPPRIPDRFDQSYPLVFTHGDIHLANFRLGRDGKLYMLDWGWAGLYPQWFESWAMEFRRSTHASFIPRSFLWCYWIMCGWYPRQTRFMELIGRGERWMGGCTWRVKENDTLGAVKVCTLASLKRASVHLSVSMSSC